MIATDIKGVGHFFAVVTVPPDNSESDNYIQVLQCPQVSLAHFASIEHLGRLGTLPVREEKRELLTARRQDCYFLTQTFYLQCYTNRTFHYVLIKLHGQK